MTRRWRTPAALAAILLATALCYWPGTHGGFVLDDYSNIVDNPALRITSLAPRPLLRAALSEHSGVLSRPLSLGSFAVNAYFSGLRPGPMKRTNVALHLLNGLLVFLLIRLLLDEYARLKQTALSPRYRDGTALLLAALWLLAPINLTAVLYVVQRMTSLAATFTLGALLAYMHGRRRLWSGTGRAAGIAWLLLAALVLTPLAALAKEVGALTLVYALVIEWVFYRFRDSADRRLPLVYGYFVLFLLLPGVAGALWQVPPALRPGAWAARPFDLGQRLLTEGRVLWHYLWWTLLPDIRQMTLYHDAFPVSRGLLSPWTTLPAWAGIAGLLAAAVSLRRRLPLVSFGLLWFLAGQALTATVFPLELVFEHREYLPSLGILVAVFGTLLLAEPGKRLAGARIGAVVAVTVLYGAALSLRSLDWSNPLRQAAVAAEQHPDSPRATYAYGRELALVALVDPGIAPQARAALEAADRVPGRSTSADSALILLAHATGAKLERRWFRDMTRQLGRRAANPQDISALEALVRCATRATDPCHFPAGALEAVFEAALERNPHQTYVLAIYGNYLMNVRHRPAEAVAVLRRLVAEAPKVAVYHLDLGLAAAAAGDLTTAAEELRAIRRLNRFGIDDPEIQRLEEIIAQAAAAPVARPPRP